VSRSLKISDSILLVRSSQLAIKASSCSYGAMRLLLAGAMFKFAKVKALNFAIFSSVTVGLTPCKPTESLLPAAINPINLSMHLYCCAILTLRLELESDIVQRISSTPSLVSMLGLTNKLTKL